MADPKDDAEALEWLRGLPFQKDSMERRVEVYLFGDRSIELAVMDEDDEDLDGMIGRSSDLVAEGGGDTLLEAAAELRANLGGES